MSRTIFNNLVSTSIRVIEHNNYDFRTGFGITGNIYFVYSGAASGGNGLSPGYEKQTIAAAIALCTANNDDWVIVMPGHTESIGASGALWNIAGVTIIGLGNGGNRPTVTWHTTDAVVTINAANITIRNIVTKVDIDEVVSMFLVSGADVTFDTVDFQETTSCQAIQWLKAMSGATRLKITNCTHRQATAAASAQKWIELVGVANASITNNSFMLTGNANTASHLISGSTAVSYIEIANNRLMWLGGTITKIVNLVTTSTGFICDNRLASGTAVSTATALTGDACFFSQNFWLDNSSGSALLAPAVGTDS